MGSSEPIRNCNLRSSCRTLLHVVFERRIEFPFFFFFFWRAADGTARVSFGHRETERGVGVLCRGGGFKGEGRDELTFWVHLAWGCLVLHQF
jgi:hypothetical protein